jgi:hypothetical protein
MEELCKTWQTYQIMTVNRYILSKEYNAANLSPDDNEEDNNSHVMSSQQKAKSY